jgi:hypothetical protein
MVCINVLLVDKCALLVYLLLKAYRAATEWRKDMEALLVLNERNGNLRLMVRLRKNEDRKKVAWCLENDEHRKAFDLFKKRGEVSECFPSGMKPSRHPRITLIEDML